MKKILILLITIYSFSFAFYENYDSFELKSFTSASNNTCGVFSNWSESSTAYTRTVYHSYGSGTTVNGVCTSVGTTDTWEFNTTMYANKNFGMCGLGSQQLSDGGFMDCSTGSPVFLPTFDNGSYDDNGSPSCNANYSLTGVADNLILCLPNPDNGTYDDNGDLQCNDGFITEDGSTCQAAETPEPETPPTNENPDGTCQSGFYRDLLTNTCKPSNVTNNPDGTTTEDTSSGTATNYPDGTSIITNPDTGVTITNYPDGTSITQYPDGTTTTGGSVSGGTGDLDNNSSLDNGNTSSFMCDDGAPSLVTETGFQTCDRTCESVGFIGTGTGADRVCSSSASCPDGQTKTGNDLLGNPICYEMSNNADIDLNKIETLLANIKDNTSLDKNSNKQLGTINNNIVTTNGKLEAVKGGLSIINKNVVGTNAKLEAVKGGLSIVDTSVNKVNTSIEASNGYLDGITTILSDMVSPIDSDKQNEYETQISSHLTNTLNDSFSKYSNVLGFGSSYGSTPSNITVTLFNTQFTLIDFTILDNFVSIIRSLFHTLAYLYGFMFFLRGSK